MSTAHQICNPLRMVFCILLINIYWSMISTTIQCKCLGVCMWIKKCMIALFESVSIYSSDFADMTVPLAYNLSLRPNPTVPFVGKLINCGASGVICLTEGRHFMGYILRAVNTSKCDQSSMKTLFCLACVLAHVAMAIDLDPPITLPLPSVFQVTFLFRLSFSNCIHLSIFSPPLFYCCW